MTYKSGQMHAILARAAGRIAEPDMPSDTHSDRACLGGVISDGANRTQVALLTWPLTARGPAAGRCAAPCTGSWARTWTSVRLLHLPPCDTTSGHVSFIAETICVMQT